MAKRKTTLEAVEAALDAAIEETGETMVEETVVPTEIEGLTAGRMVHWVNERGVHRPAVIVEVWDKVTGCSNLQVFTDGRNDGFSEEQGTYWARSADYDASEQPRLFTWHFIERA